MSREKHPSYSEYEDFILNHENYKGLYINLLGSSIKWVETGNSPKGKLRRVWWDEQCDKYGIQIKAGCYALIAVKIHPTKKHVCQICGKSLSIEYVYPNKRTIKFFKEKLYLTLEPYSKDIYEIIDEVAAFSSNNIQIIASFFKLDNISSISMLKDSIRLSHVKTSSKSCLSPGVMSNSPDRFDGFHSDGACCRHESDKGRSKENLSRYTQDRRAYEFWSDGDWKQADRLMAEFQKHKVSPDHIGPISLGFCHRPKFIPLTSKANSSKGNRMSLSDVKMLLDDERLGDTVVSWHSKYIWDLLKFKVHSDQDAKELSSLMRKNLHQVLLTFSKIKSADTSYRLFLETFLKPEYSYKDYSFQGFNPHNGSYKSVSSKVLTGQNQQNNAQRHIRIAFEALEEYQSKGNRKIEEVSSSEIDSSFDAVLSFLEIAKFDDAKKSLKTVFRLIAELIAKNYRL